MSDTIDAVLAEMGYRPFSPPDWWNQYADALSAAAWNRDHPHRVAVEPEPESPAADVHAD